MTTVDSHSRDETLRLGEIVGRQLLAGDVVALAGELGARMQVELVHSGGEALRALKRDRFDAVLCDLRMPDLSGAEVYRRTAERDREQAARFVFITGVAGAAREAEFLRQVGRPVLEKPFAMADLWRTVGAVVGEP